MNLLSLGFPADVGEAHQSPLQALGRTGIHFRRVHAPGVASSIAAFPHRLNGSGEWDRRPCLFLTFSNSKFTGGKMMIAPKADPTDGQIEYVRWGPIGRLRLLWTFPRLFTGTHIDHPLASRAAAQRIDFDARRPGERDGGRRNSAPGLPLARNSARRAGRDRMKKRLAHGPLARSLGRQRNPFCGRLHVSRRSRRFSSIRARTTGRSALSSAIFCGWRA